MGRLRDGPAEVPRPGNEPLVVSSDLLSNLASEQQRGAIYVGQCVLEPGARVSRAPTILPYVQHLGPPPSGNASSFRHTDFAVEMPDPALLAMPIPQMPRMLSVVRSSGAGLSGVVQRGSTPSGGGARTRGSTPVTPGGTATTPSSRPLDLAAVRELRSQGLSGEATDRQLPAGCWTGSQMRQRYLLVSRNSSGGGASDGLEVPDAGNSRRTTPRRTTARVRPPAASDGGKDAGSEEKGGDDEDGGDGSGEGTEGRGGSAATAKRRRTARAADASGGGGGGGGTRTSTRQLSSRRRREADGGRQSATPPPPPASVSAGAAATAGGSHRATASGWELLGEPVNRSFTNRRGGDRRVKLRRLLPEAPQDCTVAEAHQLSSLAGIQFYSQAEVEDPEEPGVRYLFSLDDSTHCACFYLGQGRDGSAVISWSDLITLYELPDGTRWAEHGHFHDADDLEALMGTGQPTTLDLARHELVRQAGRYHSRLHDIEMECWVYPQQVPSDCSHDPDNTFFWRHVFDPQRRQLLPASTTGQDAAFPERATGPDADGADGLRSRSAPKNAPAAASPVEETGMGPVDAGVGSGGDSEAVPADTRQDSVAGAGAVCAASAVLGRPGAKAMDEERAVTADSAPADAEAAAPTEVR